MYVISCYYNLFPGIGESNRDKYKLYWIKNNIQRILWFGSKIIMLKYVKHL